jgi:hypothetical protein
MNCYAPRSTLQIVPAVDSARFLVAIKFDAFLENGVDQACHGAHAFPVKIPGSMDKRIQRAVQVAVREFSSLALKRSMALYLPLNLEKAVDRSQLFRRPHEPSAFERSWRSPLG